MITTNVYANVQSSRLVAVDLFSTQTLVHVFKIQLPLVFLTSISSILRHATVFARLNNNAFAEQLLSMPLADAQLLLIVLHLKCMTQSLVSADVPQLLHAVADSSSTASHAPVLLIQMQDASHRFTFTTPTFAIADAEQPLNAHAGPLHSMPPVLALRFRFVNLHKCLIKHLAHASVHPFSNVVVDLFSIPFRVLV